MQFTRDPWAKADKLYEECERLLEEFFEDRLFCEYAGVGNKGSEPALRNLRRGARAVMRACVNGVKGDDKLDEEQNSVLHTRIQGVLIADVVKLTRQHRDVCRKADRWGPEAAESLKWLRMASKMIAGERHAARREATLLKTQGIDESEGIKAFWTNSVVQGIGVLAVTSAILPILGISFMIGFGPILANPAIVYMTLLDYTTAGTTSIPFVLQMVGAYGMARWLTRMRWPAEQHEYALSRFPARVEGYLVAVGYFMGAVPFVFDNDSGWTFRMKALVIGAFALAATVTGRKAVSYTVRHERWFGTAMSVITLMLAGAAYSGALRRDRQEQTDYSYILTTRGAVYSTCEYVRLHPVARIVVLEARRAGHTIILKTEDLTEVIRMDPGTVRC